MHKKQRIILELLIERGPLTGLGIVEASEGAIGRGTVYVHLSHLKDAERVSGPDDARLYRVTETGRRALADADLASGALVPAMT